MPFPANIMTAVVATDVVWTRLNDEARQIARQEPALRGLLDDCIFRRQSLGEALSVRIARKLGKHALPFDELYEIFLQATHDNERIAEMAGQDMAAVVDRDPACDEFVEPFLFFKGFQALTAYRFAHHLWKANRRYLAAYMQSIISEEFSVDIHPAAVIGSGIMFDHATSIVIGETAMIEDDVSILHEVTLGGTGKEDGDRHPKVRSGVMIGAGAKILGRVDIGECAKIGAGSVVLHDVAAHTTVAGVPAKKVGSSGTDRPALCMDQRIDMGTE